MTPQDVPERGKRPDRRHVERHAYQAIARRLCQPAPADTVQAISRDGRDLVVRLNSGGNALAVESHLVSEGYLVEFAGSCAVRVRGSR